MDFKFIHAADIHLGSPFRGIRDVSSEIGERLCNATFSAFDNIIDACIRHEVDFLLVAGDVFDAEDRSLMAQLHFRKGLSRLSRQNIACFVAHGNHDPLSGWSATLEWPELVHIFREIPESIPVIKNGETIAHVTGMSYPTSDIRENLSLRFLRPEDSPFSIGLLHANVGRDTGHEPYAPCTLDDLEKSGMDYWALGHVHKRSILKEQNPAIVYPGNTQGLHINETGEKGCSLVNVSNNKIEKTTFLPAHEIQWVSLCGDNAVDISDLETDDDLYNAVYAAVDSVEKETKGRSCIIRMELKGRGRIHSSLIRESYLSDMVEALRNEHAAASPFKWVERIENHTKAYIDRDERKKGEDFVAELIRMCDDIRQSPDLLSQASHESLDELFQKESSLPDRIQFPDDQEIDSIIDDAESLLLDLLTGEAES